MVPDKFLKPYNPAETEPSIYERWEASGFFNPDSLAVLGAEERGTDAEQRGRKPRFTEPFTIVMPPPNVTGVLHMGHALMLTIEDILIRFKRMQGFKTLWLPGTDHAAIATQAVVEKKISKEEDKSRHDLGRDEFLKRVEAFAAQSHDTILSQIKTLGASCDWSREAYTLDEKRSLAVRTMFKSMFDDGLIYRGHRIVNWDPKGQTTISDDEIVYEERPANLYTFKYSKDFPISISTTRPETKVGDVAVAVHPDDARYQAYIGKEYDAIFCDVPIHIKIVADKAADPEFGTGAVGVTPAHSMTDWEIAERHELSREVVVINEYAKMTVAGRLGGKKVGEAREEVVAWLREEGLLEKEEDITHNVATAERTGGVIEPLPKLQWFVDVNKEIPGRGKTLKDLMREPVARGEIQILPDHFGKIYFHWIDNLRDWCISRQIWYGHRIPVWYRGGMKKMGFAGDIVSQVFDTKTLTYRSRDHGFKAGDVVAFEDSAHGTIFGYGTIIEAKKVKLKNVDLKDTRHWKTYETQEELITALKRHHPEKEFDDESPIWLYTYTFSTSAPQMREEIEVAVGEAPEGEGWEQDPDTLDTWFSAGLWTFSTLGWPEKTPDLELYHPTDVLETGYEILFFWVARMILMTEYALSTAPFRTVYLHGTVRDAKGRKMSKSLGNGIDPVEIAQKFGADAGRMALIVGNTPGTDMRIAEDKIKAYKLFANKIWNIARFLLENGALAARGAALTETDAKVREEFDALAEDITQDMEQYRLYLAAEKIYHYLWDTFASALLEESKAALKGDDEAAKRSRAALLIGIFTDCLKLLHPFMPFVTEEIWESVRGADEPELLMVAKWPAH